MNDFENYEYDPIDLCACYEPMFEAPQELIDEWAAAREFEEPDGVPTFYVEDEYGTLYFYYGNTRIRVAEHFNDKGKPIGTLIEDVIRYSAAHQTEKN
ncbi:hypothetical protein [uncultured Oscillibacter sp.]|uniref:hypothetical protein n=1 Tax=uncultured Oscillibacter sp. TaxID=876091 RepID=UPI0026167B8E|nr:hypothetical protein [uncultured Oscillibacter sp.]